MKSSRVGFFLFAQNDISHPGYAQGTRVLVFRANSTHHPTPDDEKIIENRQKTKVSIAIFLG